MMLAKLKLTSNHWSVVLLQTRGSQYNPFFIEPVVKLEDVDNLVKEGKAKEMAFRAIKAAESDQHTSVFQDELVRKFINIVMRHGKKALARELVEKAFENIKITQIEKYHKAPANIKDSIECNPVAIFHKALENCTPVLHLTPIKRGAIVYQVPVPIRDTYSRFTAMRWIIEAAKEKQRKIHFPETLAWELLSASKNEVCPHEMCG